MIRFLAPYALPLFGALAALIAALGLGLWWSITSHAQTREALDAARAYIEATEEIRDAQETLPLNDADLADWLRDFADGR